MLILNLIKSKLDEHTFEVLSKSTSSALVKILGIAASLLLSILLGRNLGAEGLGIINLSNRLITFIMVFCLLGIPNYLIKNIAISVKEKDWKNIGTNILTARVLSGLLSLIVSLIFILSSNYISNTIFNEPKLYLPLVIAFFLMTPQVFSRIHASGFIGFKKIWQSNLVNQTLSVWITMSLVLLMLYLDVELNVINVALLYAVGKFSVFICTWIYWRKLYDHPSGTTLNIKETLSTSLPLLIVSATSIITSSTAIIILGWFESSSEVGLFSVSSRLAMFTVFFLQITNSSIAPKIAVLYKSNMKKDLEKMVQRTTSGLILIGLLILLLFIFLGKPILSLWGKEFIQSYNLLIIMAFGQFINISTGAGAKILMMCGFEKIQSKVSIFFLVFNIGISYILIGQYGALGAALAMSITIIGENITRLIFAKLKVGIWTIPIFRKT